MAKNNYQIPNPTSADYIKQDERRKLLISSLQYLSENYTRLNYTDVLNCEIRIKDLRRKMKKFNSTFRIKTFVP